MTPISRQKANGVTAFLSGDGPVVLAFSLAFAIALTLAVVPPAEAGQRSGSVAITGSNGNTTVCDHSAGGGQRGTTCTGPGGRAASTGVTSTVNEDGSLTRTRSSVGPGGRTGGYSATYAR